MRTDDKGALGGAVGAQAPRNSFAPRSGLSAQGLGWFSRPEGRPRPHTRPGRRRPLCGLTF